MKLNVERLSFASAFVDACIFAIQQSQTTLSEFSQNSEWIYELVYNEITVWENVLKKKVSNKRMEALTELVRANREQISQSFVTRITPALSRESNIHWEALFAQEVFAFLTNELTPERE